MGEKLNKMRKYALTVLCCIIILPSYGQDPGWTVNEHDYQFTMSIMAFININGETLSSTDDKISAFVDGECRGVANLSFEESEGKYFAFLVVHANTVDELVQFKIYDSEKDSVVNVDGDVVFEINKHYGNLFQAFSLASPALSTEAEILDLSIDNIDANDILIEEDKVLINVENAVDVTDVNINFQLSSGAELFNGSIKIEPGNNSLDFSESLILHVRSEDQSVLKQWEVVVQPSFGTLTYNVNENRAIGTLIGSFTAVGQGQNDGYSYDFVAGVGDSDNSSFKIEGEQLLSNAIFNFEIKSSYNIRVKTEAPSGTSYEERFIITVTDINEAPKDIVLNDTSINENNEFNELIGTFLAIDEDNNENLTYSLNSGIGDLDNTLFKIVNNQLFAGQIFDFELIDNYLIRVQVKDNGGLTYSEIFSIGINDIYETPKKFNLDFSSVGENNADNEFIGTFTLAESTGKKNTKYSFTAGNGDTDNSLFKIKKDELFANATFDFETKPYFEIRVRAKSKGKYYEENFIIRIDDINEAPTDLVLSTTSINENSTENTLIGILNAIDEDLAENFTYSLITGSEAADNLSFTIDGDQLLTAQIFDFELKENYNIVVQVEDKNGLTYPKNFSITINDLDETPENFKLDISSIAENNSIDDLIGNLTSTDNNPSQTKTYALISGPGDKDNASFKIVGAQLFAAVIFDFEQKDEHSIRVQMNYDSDSSYVGIILISILNELESNVEFSGDLIFETTSLNLGSTPQIFNIRNTGEKPVNVLIEENPDGFILDKNYLELDIGQEDSIQIIFSPTVAKSYLDSLVVSFDEGNQQAIIQLSGDGAVITATKTEPVNNPNIIIYPNPTSNLITIDLSEFKLDRPQLDFISPNGKSLLRIKNILEDKVSFEVDQYPSGLYLIRIANRNSVLTKKVQVIN